MQVILIFIKAFQNLSSLFAILFPTFMSNLILQRFIEKQHIKNGL